VPLVDVLRAAVAEVEDYTRIKVTSTTRAALAGPAVGDIIHLIAELAENAAIFSPPNTPVLIGASDGLTREDAEHLSAVAAGFQSLARGAGRHFGGGQVRQTIVEMETAFLFVTAAGEGSCLAVLSPAAADAGLIAYEMAVLVKRVGQHLAVNPRPGPAGAGPD